MKRSVGDIRANLDHVGCDNETAREMCDEIEKWQRATRDLLLRQGYALESLEPTLRNLKD